MIIIAPPFQRIRSLSFFLSFFFWSRVWGAKVSKSIPSQLSRAIWSFSRTSPEQFPEQTNEMSEGQRSPTLMCQWSPEPVHSGLIPWADLAFVVSLGIVGLLQVAWHDVHYSVVRYLWVFRPFLWLRSSPLGIRTPELASSILQTFRGFGGVLFSPCSFLLVLTDEEPSFLTGLSNLLNFVFLSSHIRIRCSRRNSWNHES
jgi:hypothetical protein